jgi:hypothetical protein
VASYFLERIENMRVRLSYTVDENEVLKEAAKLVNLSADEMQEAVTLFNVVQEELRGHEGEAANVTKCLEQLHAFREHLLNMDTRFNEVVQIVEGWVDHRRSPQPTAPAIVAPPVEEDPDASAL